MERCMLVGTMHMLPCFSVLPKEYDIAHVKLPSHPHKLSLYFFTSDKS